MEERKELTTIFKAKDPDKLIVFHGESSEDEIRFYLNDTKYITAINCGDGNISVKLGEKVEEVKEENQKSKLAIIKENSKEFLKVFSLFLSVVLGTTVMVLAMTSLFNNILSYLFFYFAITNIVYFIMLIVTVMLLESNSSSMAIRSKHSAEHMMINFLEKNRRLPKNMQEIRKSSRFSTDCGSKELIKGTVEDFISKMFAIIMAFAISSCVAYFFKNIITELIVFFGAYYLFKFIASTFFKKNKKMETVVKPIKNVLTNIVQYANTTKKVKDEDIFLAYCVAKEWIQVVYPEFYNQEEDVFLNNYLS